MRYRIIAFGLVLAACSAGAAYAAEEVRALVRHGDQIRAVLLRIEGDSVLVPLLACGSLLNAEIDWDRRTNRWKLSTEEVAAGGYLDEPLVMLSGKPFLVGKPPRLIKGQPYMSLEILKLLGRQGWQTDISYDENSEELLVREVRAQPAETVQRVRAITVPEVPAGRSVIVLDAGHSRNGGVRMTGNRPAGEFALELARKVSATLAFWSQPPRDEPVGERGELGSPKGEAASPTGSPEGETDSSTAVVILQGQEEELEPTEVASIINALNAKACVSFHVSSYGAPGIAVWCWSDRNMVSTGVSFAAFEQAAAGQKGWATAARQSQSASLSLARRIIANLQDSPLPAEGPYLAPLLPLEGLDCPAVVVDILGAATPEGAALLREEENLARLCGAIARALLGNTAPPPPSPTAMPKGSP